MAEDYTGDTYRPARDITVEYVGDRLWRTPQAARYYGEQAEICFDRFHSVRMTDDELKQLVAKATAYLAERPSDPTCVCPRNDLGMVGDNPGNCPVHPLPGCPNPECRETWIKSFHGDHCDSCGWTSEAK